MTDSAKYRSRSQFEEFLLNFYKLRQNARIHSDNHRLVIRGIEKFSESLYNCVENESLTLKISNDQLFIDDEKLPYNRNTKNLFDNIIRYFDTRGLEGVQFLEAVKHVSGEEILAFLRLLEQSGQKPEPLTWLTDCLATRNPLTRTRRNGGKGPEKTTLTPRPLSKKLPRRLKTRRVWSV
jgi:hypothetical protein